MIKGDLPKDLKVAMGIADFYENKMDSLVTAQAKLVYSYGKQSENQDNLGMAVLSRQPATARIYRLGETPTGLSDITSSYLIEEPVKAGIPVRFRFFSGWSLSDPAFASAAGFRTWLNQELDRVVHPVVVE